MNDPRTRLLLLGALALSGCEDIAPVNEGETSLASNVCQSQDDCSSGRCDLSLGACVAQNTEYESLVLEIIPPTTDTDFGGRRFYRTIRNLQPPDEERPPLRLDSPPTVGGLVTLRINDNESAACNAEPRPVSITFTPKEQRLGFDSIKYSVTSDTKHSDRLERFEHTYSLVVPEGTYDVYWEDAFVSIKAPSPLCEVVPRLQRNVEIKRVNGSVEPLPLRSPEQIRPIQISLKWRDDLEGWRVDLIHQRTGERLSTRGTITQERTTVSSSGDELAVVDLLLGEVVGDDSVPPGSEVLRLTPPADSQRPTILMGIQGLELFSPGVVQVPDLKPFESLVQYKAWVWEDDNPDKPVTGTATFEAVQLADVPESLTARYSRQVEIDDQGLLSASLPPGTYVARVLPASLTLAAFETVIQVFKPPGATDSEDAPPPTQAGRVISVPGPVNIQGHVKVPQNSEFEGISVEAASPRRPSGGSVTARSPFVPRTVETLVDQDGRFLLQPTDCGRCEEELGAVFDVNIVPPPGSALPWVVMPELLVSQSLDLGEVAMDIPVVYERTLEFVKPNHEGAFPNALVRAYVLLDDQNAPADPELTTCNEQLKASDAEATPCVRRALQVAEARTDEAGQFRLFLPRRLDIRDVAP